MKKGIVLSVFVCLLAAWLPAAVPDQQAKPYSYIFDNVVGKAVYTGATFDQVWQAAIKAFSAQKLPAGITLSGKLVEPNQASKTMSGTWFGGKGLSGVWLARLNVMFEEKPESISLVCTAVGKDVPKKNLITVQTKFFEAVASALYPGK